MQSTWGNVGIILLAILVHSSQPILVHTKTIILSVCINFNLNNMTKLAPCQHGQREWTEWAWPVLSTQAPAPGKGRTCKTLSWGFSKVDDLLFNIINIINIITILMKVWPGCVEVNKPNLLLALATNPLVEGPTLFWFISVLKKLVFEHLTFSIGVS